MQFGSNTNKFKSAFGMDGAQILPHMWKKQKKKAPPPKPEPVPEEPPEQEPLLFVDVNLGTSEP